MSEPAVKVETETEKTEGTTMVTPATSSSSINETGDKNAAAASGDTDAKKKRPEAPDQPHHPIAEFLYQLTKMLTDDNSEIVEWSQGRIKVHHPQRLETELLHKYFRHSKFASFQRQLNYFGFRKIAGKGKMAPCSYVNEAATSDIRSLLLIKRKTNGSAARKAAMKLAAEQASASQFAALGGLPPHMASGAMTELMRSAIAGGYNPAAASNHALLQQLQNPLYAGDGALAVLAAQQKRQSANDLARYGLNPALGATLEHLNSQLGAAAGAFPPHLNAASLAAAAAGPTAAASADNAASTMPATAAMNAAASSGKSNQLFESNNLKSFVNEQQAAQAAGQAAAAKRQAGGRVTSQSLLNRLPSSGTIFPDSLSSASLSHLLPGALSSNRLNSMISLSSYLSREPSLVDLLLAQQAPGAGAPPAGYPMSAAAAAAAGLPSQSDAAASAEAAAKARFGGNGPL